MRPWLLAKAYGFILVSELLPGITSASSKVVKYMAGSDMQVNFYAIAKTMPIVTAVVCFLSTQNMGS